MSEHDKPKGEYPGGGEFREIERRPGEDALSAYHRYRAQYERDRQRGILHSAPMSEEQFRRIWDGEGATS